MLALAGALLQVLLRNPLADPYVLGVSGGAASFAVLALLAGASWWGVDAASFAGALLSIALVLAFARRESGAASRRRPRRASCWWARACHGLGRSHHAAPDVAPDERLRGILFWLTGDLNGAGNPWPAVVALVVALAVSVPAAPQLNVLLRGEALAFALGVPTARLRLRIYLVASLAAAVAVTTAGTIGFVGLVVPHALRLACGNDQRMLVPASALAGGIAVMGCDLVARTIVAPAQLPVGIDDGDRRRAGVPLDAHEERAMSANVFARSSAAPGEPLSAQGLVLRAGERVLLEGFTQRFGPGEIWCIAGPNGAGKTTLIATLAGILRSRPRAMSSSAACASARGRRRSSRGVVR